MASTGVNVLRWSALFSGITYGFYHQSTLSSQQKINEANRKYHHEESLIAKAKAEFVKKSKPQDQLSAGGDVISDPMDPKFDLEAWLKTKFAQEA